MHLPYQRKPFTQSSPGMARRAARLKLLELVVATMLVILAPCILVAQGKHPPKHFTLYAHESRVNGTATLIVSADPSGNGTGRNDFGLIRTVSNILKEGPDKYATILGWQVGIVVVGLTGEPVYISYTYFLNANATHQGTIAVQGYIDGFSTANRVFAVVGGTGEFLSATGFDTLPFDILNPPDPSNVVNVHNLTLHYPTYKTS